MSHTTRQTGRREPGDRSNTSEVLADLVRALSDPGAIHPALAAAVREQALAVHEFGRQSLRGTAFDGRLFAIVGPTMPEVRTLIQLQP